MPGGVERVWVHPSCRGRYVPTGDAAAAFLSLDDPIEIDGQGWVKLQAIEAQRGRWNSDSADFVAGLAELVDRKWVEANTDGTAFRVTPTGTACRGRLGLK